MANGDVRFYYMDTDYFVPIKIDTKRMIRGAEREFETILGDYKEVNGWYLPFSIESGVKGSQFKSKVTYEKIEANVALEDARFHQPAAAGAKGEMKSPDASETLPKKPEEKKASEKPAGEKPEERKHR
jgi:hypothetical protein